jgi:hypothetical protein
MDSKTGRLFHAAREVNELACNVSQICVTKHVNPASAVDVKCRLLTCPSSHNAPPNNYDFLLTLLRKSKKIPI